MLATSKTCGRLALSAVIVLLGCQDPTPPAPPSQPAPSTSTRSAKVVKSASPAPIKGGAKPHPRATTAVSFCGQELQPNVKEVECSDASVTELKPLMGLQDIEKLNLLKLGVTDLRPLAHLKKLTRLSLWNTADVRDLGPLSRLISLQWLSLLGTGVRSIGPIQDLPNLKQVDLRKTAVPLRQAKLFAQVHPDCKLLGP